MLYMGASFREELVSLQSFVQIRLTESVILLAWKKDSAGTFVASLKIFSSLVELCSHASKLYMGTASRESLEELG